MELVYPLVSDWPQPIEASGRIVPWQESIVGATIGDLRLEEVRVEVGDVVARGELLARFDAAVPAADFAMAEASVAQAEANAALAREKAARARRLESAGNLSQQDLLQFEAEEKASASQLAAARAQQELQRLRLLQVEVRAPDDGVISARSATVGAVGSTGAELFRLIRRGRLEWHARVPAEELPRVAPGQRTTVRLGRATVAGIVRQVSPVVDAGTLNGTVHVDLPDSTALRTGMFVSGVIEFPATPALHVPESAWFSATVANTSWSSTAPAASTRPRSCAVGETGDPWKSSAPL